MSVFIILLTKYGESSTSSPVPPVHADSLLMETGDYLLLENGDTLLLE